MCPHTCESVYLCLHACLHACLSTALIVLITPKELSLCQVCVAVMLVSLYIVIICGINIVNRAQYIGRAVYAGKHAMYLCLVIIAH